MWRFIGTGLRFLAGVTVVRPRSPSQAQVALPAQCDQIESQQDRTPLPSPPNSTSLAVLAPTPLEHNEIDNALEVCASYPRGFTLGELLNWLDLDVDLAGARQRLMDDPRFICLGGQGGDEEIFVPERTLFRFWSHLALRLSRAKRSRLSRHELAMAMGSVRVEGRWDAPPHTAIEFGRRFGLVSHIRTSDHYAFPLAQVLSYLAPSSLILVSEMLRSLDDTEARDFALNQPLEGLVQQGLAGFDQRVVEVVTAREGVEQAERMTLEQIGTRLGVSRERVRQIEEKFWKRLQRKHRITMRPFLNAFCYDIMRRQGSLIVDVKSPDSSLRRLVAKCIGVPELELRHVGLVVLGASAGDVSTIADPGQCRGFIDEAAVVSRLASESKVNLSNSDLTFLGERLAQYHKRRFTKSQGVVLALKEIGRPAHYSEIAAAYKSLFPNDESNDHNIHAILNRQQYGIVWIGGKGMYGLTEWGCERPSISIFNAVTEIVKTKHAETGSPVPFAIIVAEMGRYRQRVHPTSLLFAAHFNPRLQQVTKDSFIPKEPADRGQEEITADELDRILRDFEEATV